MKLLQKILLFFCVLFSLQSCKEDPVQQLEQKLKYMAGPAAELGTVEYTISKIIKVDHDVFYKYGERKVLFSSRSTMKAGINLSKFSVDNVIVDKKNNTITVKLPKAEILSFNMPAEDVKLEYSRTSGLRHDFTATERNELLKQAEENIKNDAPNLGIFKEAEDNMRLLVEGILSGAGFNEVVVEFN